MLKFLKVAACIMLTTSALAQSIRGTVRDAASKQVLTGATVQVENSTRLSVTDERGFFMMEKLAPGQYKLIVKFLGFESLIQVVDLSKDVTLNIDLKESYILTDEVVIRSTRAGENSPTTFLNIDKRTLEKQNFGQDLPLVLNWTPSLVTTSDAGAGIGYTGVRIRGSDATRVNVTINGIPYNDSESQGTFWVNMPDIVSSTQSVQIQRGVGTSTNGGSAFGASINLQTNTKNEEAHAELVNSFGSFGTRRHTLGFGTGLLKKGFVLDGRLSKIDSDGFIDRASSDLQSYYFASGFYAGNTIVRALAFGGKERTYQSWYGVPQSRLNNDADAMLITAMNEGWNQEQTDNLLNSDSRTFNPYLYPNQVDNYGQYHYQLHFSQRVNEEITANTSLHYTKGKGYFEEYRYDNDFEDYGLAPVIVDGSPVESSDLIRRRWLDNDFYGVTYSVNYDTDKISSVLGGAWNRYVCDHFGEIIWSEVAVAPPGYQYYFNVGDKHDFNIFLKTTYQVTNQLSTYVDLQYRGVSYKTGGIENRQNEFFVDADYNFFNPKVGLTYSVDGNNQFYASFAVANKEPVRDDFVDNVARTPKHETLHNLETGYRFSRKNLLLNANYYLMRYRNQLVLTGAINDVGATVRANADESYRTGIEIETTYQLTERLKWNANINFSQNKIVNFTEVVYDYGVNYDEYNEVRSDFKDTDISFSPNVIVGSVVSWTPLQNAEISLLTKYVGKQYLDNTSNTERSIDAYLVNDIRMSYAWRPTFMKEITVSLLINNLFNEAYEANGYTYGYLGGGQAFRENFYYPQAGTNFLTMLTLKL